jgi:hypothetical protein
MLQPKKFFLAIIALCICQVSLAQTTTIVKSFDKVVVSPHIQVTFVEGNEESVTVESNAVSNDKLNIEVKDKTLRIYLDDAKEITKNNKVYDNGYKEKRSIYNGTIVKAIVTYKTLRTLSVRGEETIVCSSNLTGKKFNLKIYGESHVILKEVNLGELRTTIYGESYLDIKSGTIATQRYTTYGEGKINTLGVNNNSARITAYGESDFSLNVSDTIKITAYGEAKLQYTGNPVITKGLHFGEMHIDKMD